MKVCARLRLLALLTPALLTGCPTPGGTDAAIDAYCPLTVEVGASGGATFTPYEDGDQAQVVLGFQGFQMLVLDVRLRGAMASRADVSAFIHIDDNGVEASHAERGIPTVVSGDGVLVQGFLLFFNDAPLSQLQGHDATLELIARGGGCVGTARVAIRLSDQPPCIDPTSTIPDVASRDAGGIPDGAVLCMP
jgi:hypothetical protein